MRFQSVSIKRSCRTKSANGFWYDDFFFSSLPSVPHPAFQYYLQGVSRDSNVFFYIIINTIYLEIKLNCQYFYTHTLYMTPVPIYQFLFYLSFCTTLTPCVRLWLEFVITVHWFPFIYYIYRYFTDYNMIFPLLYRLSMTWRGSPQPESAYCRRQEYNHNQNFHKVNCCGFSIRVALSANIYGKWENRIIYYSGKRLRHVIKK